MFRQPRSSVKYTGGYESGVQVVQAVSLAVIRYSCYKATRLDTITKGVSINRKELRGLSPGKLPRLIVWGKRQN